MLNLERRSCHYSPMPLVPRVIYPNAVHTSKNVASEVLTHKQANGKHHKHASHMQKIIERVQNRIVDEEPPVDQF